LKRFNKIDFEALNQGSSGPNTAEFKVYDDKGSLISAISGILELDSSNNNLGKRINISLQR
jgi:hypothetical protein